MVKKGLAVSFMSDIAAAGARDEKFMPWGVLLLKNQYTLAFLGGILRYGVYGTKEPGRARSYYYQIVVFIFFMERCQVDRSNTNVTG